MNSRTPEYHIQIKFVKACFLIFAKRLINLGESLLGEDREEGEPKWFGF
jgi:hypothetical protein